MYIHVLLGKLSTLPLSYTRQGRIYFSPKIPICKGGVLVGSRSISVTLPLDKDALELLRNYIKRGGSVNQNCCKLLILSDITPRKTGAKYKCFQQRQKLSGY